MSRPKTVGEEMLEQMQKISQSLELLTSKGLPESLLILAQRDIKAVLEALKDVEKEFNQPLP